MIYNLQNWDTAQPYKVTKYDATEWHVNGVPHRNDGPAIIWVNGSKCWYQKGKLHREDGPAIEYKDGHKRWYAEGHEFKLETFTLNLQCQVNYPKLFETMLIYLVHNS
jgi:hypothetical protein